MLFHDVPEEDEKTFECQKYRNTHIEHIEEKKAGKTDNEVPVDKSTCGAVVGSAV